MTTHEDIRDLLPGYALGALDAEETATVESHLRGCREHDEELVELRATVLALGALGDEREPSAALANEIDRLAGGITTIAVAPRERASPHEPRSTAARTARAGRAWWPRAAGAAALVAVIFAAGWLAGSRLGAEDQYTYLVQAPDGVVLEFSGVAGADTVTVWMAGFDRLPPDQRYQLWAIRDDRWLSIGVCNTNPEGRWLGDFDFTLATGEEIAVTIEPAPGSDRPTAEPLLRTQF